MIIKQIACDLLEAKKELFSTGQGEWKALEGVNGFIGQIGGWSETEKNRAYVFSFWQDEPSYLDFMKNEHDQIADYTKQKDCISSIRVAIFKEIYKIKDGIDFSKKREKDGYIRFTNPVVKDNQVAHFENMQRDVWNNGMAQEKGMLAGYFAKSELLKENYLVLSEWNNKDSHLHYTANKLGHLMEASNVTADVTDIFGDCFEVEPSWCLSNKFHKE